MNNPTYEYGMVLLKNDSWEYMKELRQYTSLQIIFNVIICKENVISRFVIWNYIHNLVKQCFCNVICRLILELHTIITHQALHLDTDLQVYILQRFLDIITYAWYLRNKMRVFQYSPCYVDSVNKLLLFNNIELFSDAFRIKNFYYCFWQSREMCTKE